MSKQKSSTLTVLLRLGEPGSGLRELEAGGWGVTNRTGKPVARLGDAQFQAFVSADLITASDTGNYVLSPAGRAWVARQLGGAEGFRRQHQRTRHEPIKTPNGITLELERNLCESPLAWLRSRKDKAGRAHISDEQFRAGERLRADFTRAQMGPKVTATWSASSALAGADATVQGAMMRWR